jgi:hypothetical protein
MNDNNEPIKKEVGGMKLPDGFAIGQLYFSKDGKTAAPWSLMGLNIHLSYRININNRALFFFMCEDF